MSLGDQETHKKSTHLLRRRLYSNCQEFVFLQVRSHFQGTVMLFLILRRLSSHPSSRQAVSLPSERSSPERHLVPWHCAPMLAVRFQSRIGLKYQSSNHLNGAATPIHPPLTPAPDLNLYRFSEWCWSSLLGQGHPSQPGSSVWND